MLVARARCSRLAVKRPGRGDARARTHGATHGEAAHPGLHEGDIPGVVLVRASGQVVRASGQNEVLWRAGQRGLGDDARAHKPGPGDLAVAAKLSGRLRRRARKFRCYRECSAAAAQRGQARGGAPAAAAAHHRPAERADTEPANPPPSSLSRPRAHTLKAARRRRRVG